MGVKDCSLDCAVDIRGKPVHTGKSFSDMSGLSDDVDGQSCRGSSDIDDDLSWLCSQIHPTIDTLGNVGDGDSESLNFYSNRKVTERFDVIW